MLGKILSIEGNYVELALDIDINAQASLVNLHVVFEDDKTKVVGEIRDVSKTTLKIAIVGEFVGNQFLAGFNRKPSFKSKVRIIKVD